MVAWPELRELFARRAVAQLRLVAEREQRLLAAGRCAGARDRQHLVEREIGALALARRLREGAVVADVAAELRQRDEDLARIGDERPCAASRRAAAARISGSSSQADERERLLAVRRLIMWDVLPGSAIIVLMRAAIRAIAALRRGRA